jgi:catechol 2,3-dioxygenase
LSETAWSGLPAGTVIGHVHLRVAHIAPAERFYCDLLGFELTARYGANASFVASGGYHHHAAFNTWSGVGAPPPPEGTTGLSEFVVHLPDADSLERVLARLAEAGVPVAPDNLVRDPSGNGLRLATRATSG